jgi:hypothetical protein
MTRDELVELYSARLEERRGERERRGTKVFWVSYARLLVFVAGVAMAWFVWETDSLPWPWLSAPLAAFAALMNWHAHLYDGLRRAERSEKFYTRGLERLRDEWAGSGDQGTSYVDAHHPYASDLDVFGKGSLFELLATTESPWGTRTLAKWLRTPASPEIVRQRQAAVAELAPLVALREDIAREHDEAVEKVDPETLSQWAMEPSVLTSRGARLAALVLGVASLVAGIGWLASWWTRLPFVGLITVSATFAIVYRPRVRSVLSAVEDPASALAVLSMLLERLEGEGFSSPLLVALQQALVSEGEPASKAIRRLRRRVDYLDARRNQLFAPFAAILLWGTQFAFGIESWRQRSGPRVPQWLSAVGELDALLALGTYAFEHPTDPFPTIRDDTVVFDAEGLGHPLIPEDRLVRNDVCFGDELRLLVVSGSNMSGKSTFLRAVGINTVLAFAGAPVRARRLELSPFAVAASIRIVDSLQEGISHFYAEILRLRQVLELTSGDTTVLFLLDEILHGTNSHDRRIGADGVVRGLVERGAVGLITTHDLALSKMVDAIEDKAAANVHFEDQIVDGKIQFDYIMREGVVTKSNALDLMRSVGLDV